MKERKNVVFGYTRVAGVTRTDFPVAKFSDQVEVYSSTILAFLNSHEGDEHWENIIFNKTRWLPEEHYEDFFKGILSVLEAYRYRWEYVKTILVKGMEVLVSATPGELSTTFPIPSTSYEFVIIEDDGRHVSDLLLFVMDCLSKINISLLNKYGIVGLGIHTD